MKWKPGRKNSGYRVLTLVKLSRFDIYIIHYPEGSHIDWHTDPVEGFEHYRMTILLKDCESGGAFLLRPPGKFVSTSHIEDRRLTFRPDLSPHAVTKVTKGSRWVLSIGWLKEIRK